MNNKNSLRNMFGLEYEDSNLQSGLIKWYNRLIEKTIDDLDVIDVSKMVRQKILRDVAIDRAIEIFLINPFDGEMQDGDLLALLVSCGTEVSKNNKVKTLIAMISWLETRITDFDWGDEDSKKLFENNLIALRKIFLENKPQ